eukprot:gnl/Dysnectes_brevis/6954_a11243_354.p1 GENE.gnl/Dysnectes_brevis/6954_a11243_354~~gnl/Dysnectes_brevis/6954_a11243_354.p1  ORF type:complete len:607 (-),score=26.42 gnl/Dysnectes_brevis/6954_a11243_354:96-1916(-)
MITVSLLLCILAVVICDITYKPYASSKVIIIPPIALSPLYNQNNDQVWPVQNLDETTTMTALFGQYDADTDLYTTSAADIDIHTFPNSIPILCDELKTHLEQNGADVIVWHYDWRQSAKHLGKKLSDYISTNIDTFGDNYSLVSYREGGLITAHALTSLSDNTMPSKVVSVAVPWKGRVGVVDELLTGQVLQKLPPCVSENSLSAVNQLQLFANNPLLLSQVSPDVQQQLGTILNRIGLDTDTITALFTDNEASINTAGTILSTSISNSWDTEDPDNAIQFTIVSGVLFDTPMTIDLTTVLEDTPLPLTNTIVTEIDSGDGCSLFGSETGFPLAFDLIAFQGGLQSSFSGLLTSYDALDLVVELTGFACRWDGLWDLCVHANDTIYREIVGIEQVGEYGWTWEPEYTLRAQPSGHRLRGDIVGSYGNATMHWTMHDDCQAFSGQWTYPWTGPYIWNATRHVNIDINSNSNIAIDSLCADGETRLCSPSPNGQPGFLTGQLLADTLSTGQGYQRCIGGSWELGCTVSECGSGYTLQSSVDKRGQRVCVAGSGVRFFRYLRVELGWVTALLFGIGFIVLLMCSGPKVDQSGAGADTLLLRNRQSDRAL